MSTYQELDARLTGRCNQRRKLGNNTWAVRHSYSHWDEGGRRDHGLTSAIDIIYHRTSIIRFYEDGAFRLNTGGWFTVTTKQRLNQHLPNGYGVWSQESRWVLFWGRTPLAIFTDDMEVDAGGRFTGAQSYQEWVEERAKRRHDARRDMAFRRLRCWELINGKYCNLFLKGQTCVRHGLLALPGHEEAV